MERREDLLAAVVSPLCMMSVVLLDTSHAVYLLGMGSPADCDHGQWAIQAPIPLYIHLWTATIHLLGLHVDSCGSGWWSGSES